jgi:hypothetical protein
MYDNYFVYISSTPFSFLGLTQEYQKFKPTVMKNLESTWFLQLPIDTEHKQYILLDFLQEVNEEIRRDNIYHPIQQIFSSIKGLKLSEKILANEKLDLQKMDQEEIQIFEKFIDSKFTEE